MPQSDENYNKEYNKQKTGRIYFLKIKFGPINSI